MQHYVAIESQAPCTQFLGVYLGFLPMHQKQPNRHMLRVSPILPQNYTQILVKT